MPVVEGSFVELEIGEEWASGFDGCNGFGGRTPEGGAIFGAEGAFAVPPMAVDGDAVFRALKVLWIKRMHSWQR